MRFSMRHSTGAWTSGSPKLGVRVTKVLFKEPEWAPKHGVFITWASVGKPESENANRFVAKGGSWSHAFHA